MRQRLLPVSRVPDLEGPIALKRLLAVVLALAFMLVGASRALAVSVTPRCDTPSGRDGCNRWYTDSDVTLTWDTQPGGGSRESGCDTPTFKNEMARVDLQCTWKFPDGATLSQPVWLGIDRTPPELLAVQPSRPFDLNDWFNHPVQLTFKARDGLSGVSSCSSTTYEGPDALGVPIQGSCTDIAGNTRSDAFPLNYDATPPPTPEVTVLPGRRRVRLRWESGPYLTEVARVTEASARKLLYRGGGERFVDRGLRNGHRYRYVVTLIDQAGNRSADKTSAVPTSSPLLMPADGAHLNHPPELVWKRVKRADYYNAQLHFRSRKVLTRWPRTTHLQLHKRWRSLGRRHRLHRGLYCWYVWPGYGPRRLQKYGKVLDRSCFRITR
jgi:hypothetical protein